MAGILPELIEQYPSLPRGVILKTALLSLGVRFDPLLIEAGKSALPDFRPYVLPDGKAVPIPYLMILEDGSLVRLRCMADSPFSMAQDRKAYRLYDDNEPVAPFQFAPRPVWHGRKASDGTLLDSCGLNLHGDMMVLNLAPACEYWTTPIDPSEEQGGQPEKTHRCGFCGYGMPDDRSRALGQEQGKSSVPAEAIQRAAEAVRMGIDAGAKHLYLTSGSMLEPNLEADRYLEVVKGVRNASEGAYLAVGSQALPPERLAEFKDAGADGVSFNQEIWDRKVWERVCPGKAKFFGREMWEESLAEAVSVFGEGNVYSAFVIGAEMVLDDTLKDPEAALKSDLEGVRWQLSRGIHPILSPFWSFTGTDMAEAAGPDLHFLLRLYSEANAIRKELNMPFPDRMACKGCLYMQVEGDF